MQWKDECILVYDSGADDLDRMLIFSNAELQRIARSAKIVHVDGTFRVCSRPFYQIFTVHCWHAFRSELQETKQDKTRRDIFIKKNMRQDETRSLTRQYENWKQFF